MICSLLVPLFISIFFIGIAYLTGKNTATQMEWYNGLKKSKLTPPSWVFSLVWSILYSLIVAAFFVFWNTGCHTRQFTIILALFIVNMLANLLWSPLFFRFHGIRVALYTCAFIAITSYLLLFILWINNFTTSATLLMPYVLWVTFATYLNSEIRT